MRLLQISCFARLPTCYVPQPKRKSEVQWRIDHLINHYTTEELKRAHFLATNKFHDSHRPCSHTTIQPSSPQPYGHSCSNAHGPKALQLRSPLNCRVVSALTHKPAKLCLNTRARANTQPLKPLHPRSIGIGWGSCGHGADVS